MITDRIYSGTQAFLSLSCIEFLIALSQNLLKNEIQEKLNNDEKGESGHVSITRNWCHQSLLLHTADVVMLSQQRMDQYFKVAPHLGHPYCFP